MSQYAPRTSGPRSNFGTNAPTNAAYPHGGSYTTGHPAVGGYNQPRPLAQQDPHTYENVPPDIKYPPGWSARPGVGVENHAPQAPVSMHAPMSIPRTQSCQVQVSEITRQLDFATSENMRLKKAIEQNNTFFEQKLQEIADQRKQVTASSDSQILALQKKVDEYKGKVTEATNQFFEARVAVMGFKCRVMQLQGKLDRKGDSAQPATAKPDDSSKRRLEDEKRRLEEENKSIGAANTLVRQDLQSLGNKKRLVEEERDRLMRELNNLQEQLKDRDSHIQQLNVHLAQAQADKQNYHNHTLRGQIQELTVRKSALEAEVSHVKERNDQLLRKMKEMQQTKEVMVQKLERLESMSPVSITPTSGASSDVAERERLDQEMRRLQTEVDSLRAERDRANRDKLAVDEMFQGSNRKSQNLSEAVVTLEGEVGQLKHQLAEEQRRVEEVLAQKQDLERRSSMQVQDSQSVQRLREDCDTLRGELRSVVSEKEELELKVSGLTRERDASMEEAKQLEERREEVRRKNQKYESEIADLEEKLQGMSLDHTSMMSMKGTLPKRLNDAMGRIKELQTAKNQIEVELEDAREEKEKQTRQFSLQVAALEDQLKFEKKESSKMAQEDVVKLQTENSDLRHSEQSLSLRVQYLEAEQQQQVEVALRLRNDVDRYRQELAQYDTDKRGMSRQMSEKEVEMAQLRQQVRELQEQLETESKTKDRKLNKLETLQQSYSDLKTNNTTLHTAHQQLVSDLENKTAQLQIVTSERERFLAEKEDLQITCDDFRKESESILQDYNTCAKRLKVAQEDAARWTAQHQKDVSDIARQKDRISLLERSRKEQEERLSHMDQQIQIYHEDFDRERNAREAAVKVKNLAEDRMKKMDKELKELRDRLNQQAVHSLSTDTYEDNSYSTPSSRVDTLPSQRFNKSGEQQSYQTSSGWNANPPNQGGQQQHHMPPQQQDHQRRSGEQPPYSQAQGIRQQPDQAPSHYGGAGRQYAGQGGGLSTHNAAWTQMTPANTSATAGGHNPRYYTTNRPAAMDPQGQGRAIDPQGQGRPMDPHGQGRGDMNMQIEYQQPPAVNDLNNPPPQPVPQLDQTRPPVAMDTVPYGGHGRQLPPQQPQEQVDAFQQPPHGRRSHQSGPEPVMAMGPPGGPPGAMGPPGGPPGGMGLPGGPPGPGPLVVMQDDLRDQTPPKMACPICSRADFKTTGELVQHSATCT